MTREQYKTPDEDVSAEFGRVCQLFQRALPGPADRIVFECLMNEASSRGLSWVDALQYVVEERSRLQSAAQAAEAAVGGMGSKDHTVDRQAADRGPA